MAINWKSVHCVVTPAVRIFGDPQIPRTYVINEKCVAVTGQPGARDQGVRVSNIQLVTLTSRHVTNETGETAEHHPAVFIEIPSVNKIPSTGVR